MYQFTVCSLLHHARVYPTDVPLPVFVCKLFSPMRLLVGIWLGVVTSPCFEPISSTTVGQCVSGPYGNHAYSPHTVNITSIINRYACDKLSYLLEVVELPFSIRLHFSYQPGIPGCIFVKSHVHSTHICHVFSLTTCLF